MINGILNIYKPQGFTSHDVVAKLRGILKQKKIGHTGTLDPDAIGVLPICLGSATRLCDFLTIKDKEYVARVRLGITTDTQDMTGKILCTRPVEVSPEKVKETLEGFLGEYSQLPPMYSAVKVNGKRLYELARQGMEIERKARTVFIKKITVLDMSLPQIAIRVECSKGTYIRTLCHDLGERLGCGAVMEHLERTRSGSFVIENAVFLEEIERLVKNAEVRDPYKGLEALLVPVDRIFSHLPALSLRPDMERLVENGNSFEIIHLIPALQKEEWEEHSQYRVYIKNNIFMGIYEYRGEQKRFCPVKMFISQ